MRTETADLRSWVKDVPDFPKKGIIFKDITPLLADPEVFASAIDRLARPYLGSGVQAVAGVESRGFILAGAVAIKLKAGLIPIRKKGKLPRATFGATYDLEYGKDTLEVHRDAAAPRTKVLLIDDVLATGGTAGAACRLMSELGAEVCGLAFLIELGFLKGREKLPGASIHSLIVY